jgi:hypothetical protein
MKGTRKRAESEASMKSVEEAKPEDKKEEVKKEKKVPPKSKIMKFYGPMWAVVGSLVTSFLGAFTFPMFGFLFTQILFIAMQPQKENYREDMNMMLMYLTILVIFMGLNAWIGKIMYSVGGENCTLAIRKSLFENIVYK